MLEKTNNTTQDLWIWDDYNSNLFLSSPQSAEFELQTKIKTDKFGKFPERSQR